MNQPAPATPSAVGEDAPRVAAPAPAPGADRLPPAVWFIAALFVAVELAFGGRYGFQQDELYFLVAGRHPALGYVDQPPLIPLLTRILGAIAVDPTVLRILPALAGAAVVVVAGRQAALLGAGRTGRILAALAVACAPVLLGASHLDNTTAPAVLAWAVVVLCASTAVLRERPRWTFSITSATLARVNMSVGYPLAFGPRNRAFPTWRNCLSDSCGGRPGRPAPVNACRPPSCHARRHRDAVCSDTQLAGHVDLPGASFEHPHRPHPACP